MILYDLCNDLDTYSGDDYNIFACVTNQQMIEQQELDMEVDSQTSVTPNHQTSDGY